MLAFLKRYRAALITLALIFLLVEATLLSYEPRVAANVLLSGLTLGAIFFLMSSGLSLIFGLMDVLNFAHGLYFMLGAYFGLTLYANPLMALSLGPLFLAFGAGVALGAVVPLARLAAVPRPALWLAAGGLLALGAWGVDAAGMVNPETIAATQEGPLVVLGRLLALAAGGALLNALMTSNARFTPLSLGVGAGLLALAAGLALARAPLGEWVLAQDSNLRFVLALLLAAFSGAGLGAFSEWALIRPLYARPIYQVLLTLGLVYVGTELIRLVWGPSGYFMELPAWFNTRNPGCRGADVFTAVQLNCATFDLLGRPFPTYRLFIITLGALMFIGVAILLNRTRIGMIIRAGVQDRDMVQALGINVQQVFTAVFALGTGLAALGGVVAAPIIGVYPGLGNEFQLQAFIAIVIGGMGSFSGSAAGSLLLGLARAVGDQLVLAGISLPWLEEALKFSPSIARASTVLIMALVLLIRPAGLFGKKE